MELLESVGPRPRQARYQAALRPDMPGFDSNVPHTFTSTPVVPVVSRTVSKVFNAISQSNLLDVWRPTG